MVTPSSEISGGASSISRRDLIQKKVQDRAQTIGNKSSNLVELKELCELIEKDMGVRVGVPDILPLSHLTVASHLDKYPPTPPSLKYNELWERFIKEQGDNQDLMPGALSYLEAIQKLVQETFEQHPLSEKEIEEFLGGLPKKKEDVLLMVRSTGKEDTVDFANPGGNESIAAVKPDSASISTAIGKVVASYFGEKSLKQRLLGKQSIKEVPFMPVLIQRMIGEPLKKVTLPDPGTEGIVYSGVMYTHSTGTRIQMAPGHGELIVNSKGAFDTYYVTTQNLVHAEIRRKEKRLVSVETIEGEKLKQKLVFSENPSHPSSNLRDNPSVPPEVALRIAKMGRHIEAHYGMAMDVEFVYDPKKDTLYLVQARPIPKQDVSLVIPSSIPPEKMPEVRKQAPIATANIVVAAGSAAHVITESNEILICQTITEALERYQNIGSPNPVKVVIVKEPAPDMSHEAALLNHLRIPVLQMPNTEVVETWLKDKPTLIIDPQRKQIVNWKKNIRLHENAKKEILEAGLIKEGFFKSPLPARVSLVPLLQERKEWASHTWTAETRENGMLLGDLITSINGSDAKKSLEAFNQLMTRLYQLLPEKHVRLKSPEMPTPYPTLLILLEEVEAARAGKSNTEAFKSLSKVIGTFIAIMRHPSWQKEGKTTDLTRQFMITAAEIHQALKELSELKPGIDKELIDLKKQAVLDLTVKLEGLITDPGTELLLSNSIRQIAQGIKTLKLVSLLPGFETLDPLGKKSFLEFFKARKILFNTASQEKWLKFSLFCCKNPERIKKLAYVLKFAFDNGIESDFLNVRLKAALEKTEAKTEEEGMNIALNQLFTESSKTKKEVDGMRLSENRAIIKSWEGRIEEWASPKKFDELWRGYEADITSLLEKLSMTSDMSVASRNALLKTVQQLTEMMDKTIKSLKGSPHYADKKQQVERFALLLGPYHELMTKWISYIPDEMFEKWTPLSSNRKENILASINRAFLRCKDFSKMSSEELLKQLEPSGVINISSATVGTSAAFDRQFLGKERLATLEDLFSLMHQNTLTSTQILGETDKVSLENFPEEMKDVIQILQDLPYKTKPTLLTVAHNYPMIETVFNLSMSSHAAKFSVVCNQENKENVLKVSFFGGETGDRMKGIVKTVNLFSSIMGLQSIQEAKYNQDKLLLEFSWKLDKASISKNAAIIKKVLGTFAEKLDSHGRSTLADVFGILSREEKMIFYKKLLEFGLDKLFIISGADSISILSAMSQSFLADVTERPPTEAEISPEDLNKAKCMAYLTTKPAKLDEQLEGIKNPIEKAAILKMAGDYARTRAEAAEKVFNEYQGDDEEETSRLETIKNNWSKIKGKLIERQHKNQLERLHMAETPKAGATTSESLKETEKGMTYAFDTNKTTVTEKQIPSSPEPSTAPSAPSAPSAPGAPRLMK